MYVNCKIKFRLPTVDQDIPHYYRLRLVLKLKMNTKFSHITETLADNTPEWLSAHSHSNTVHKLGFRFVQFVLWVLI